MKSFKNIFSVLTRIAILIQLIFFFSGCIYSTVNGPTYGLIHTDIHFAGEINLSNNVKTLKSAEGCIHGIFYLISFGNAGAGRIAKNAGIIRISRVDHSASNTFLFYHQYCTIVYGE